MSDKTRHPSRIVGIETEYGCLIDEAGPRPLAQIRDWIFERHRYGLLDRHKRGWDEPPGNGGFLFNGGRLYIDMGHLEYCTPECATLTDLVRYDRAGDRLLNQAVAALGFTGRVNFIRNNIDHRSGATFGCHENYSLLRAAPLTESSILALLAFLTLRVLFAGAGRVGEERSLEEIALPRTHFQISQRADFIQTELYEWVQHNRAIINTRDEPLADPEKYRRLHLLHGDANVVPAALFLKVGSTRLVLDLLEAGDLPAVALADAVNTLRMLSRQLQPPWRVQLRRGREADAVELLARFRLRAQARFGGRDAETDAILALWARVEDGLASDPTQLTGLVDWVTKLRLLEAFREKEQLRWDDPWLEAQDLEYHHTDPERSLGLALADQTGHWALDPDDRCPLESPPEGTRAALRASLMREIAENGEPYKLDWHLVERGTDQPIVLFDPFQSRLG